MSCHWTDYAAGGLLGLGLGFLWGILAVEKARGRRRRRGRA